MKTKENKVIWWSARILSLLVIGFSLFMFVGYRFFHDSGEPNPLSTQAIVEFVFVGIGFIGLLLAWKWEILGAVISLLGFALLCMIFPVVLILPLMYVWPINAVLFLLLVEMKRK